MNEKVFNRSRVVFLILTGIILLLFIPAISDKLFKNSVIKEWERELKYAEQEKEWLRTEPEDTSSSEGNQKILWKWKDFDGGFHKISFDVNTSSLEKVSEIREKQGTILKVVYRKLHAASLPVMKPMIAAFKQEIKKQHYSSNEAYMKAMELVVTAVQYIPYTLVLDDSQKCPCEMPFGTYTGECAVREDGRGCCDRVMPLGVYAPAEFMFHKKGDCDTRSLFAFLILKELGYDVAVMVSIQEGHSVLGVHMKNRKFPKYGTDFRNKKFFLWELTARDFRLGYDVEGSDWESYLDRSNFNN